MRSAPTVASEATPVDVLAGLPAIDGTGSYLPMITLDHLWWITGENAATRWLLGTSAVGRHLLDLFYDVAFHDRIVNHAAVAAIATRYFHLATMPFRDAAHSEHPTYTRTHDRLRSRYPAFAARIADPTPAATPLSLPPTTGAAFDTKLIEFACPFGDGPTLQFHNPIQRQDPTHPRQPAHSQGTLVPATRGTEVGLLLLHLLHTVTAPTDVGTTSVAHARWALAILETVRSAIEHRQDDLDQEPTAIFRRHLRRWNRDAVTMTAGNPIESITTTAEAERFVASISATEPDVRRTLWVFFTEAVPAVVPTWRADVLDSLGLGPSSESFPSELVSSILWRPGDSFPDSDVAAILGSTGRAGADHPTLGQGLVWTLGGVDAAETRIDLFPDRRRATVQLLNEPQPAQHLELTLAAVGVRHVPTPPALVLIGDGRGWTTFVSIVASGELSLHYRRRNGRATVGTGWRRPALAAPPFGPSSSTTPLPIPVAEAARLLGYHPTHIKNLIRRGRLRGHRLGRNWFVDPDSLASFRPQRGRR